MYVSGGYDMQRRRGGASGAFLVSFWFPSYFSFSYFFLSPLLSFPGMWGGEENQSKIQVFFINRTDKDIEIYGNRRCRFI